MIHISVQCIALHAFFLFPPFTEWENSDIINRIIYRSEGIDP